jgi:hypothetical protein
MITEYELGWSIFIASLWSLLFINMMYFPRRQSRSEREDTVRIRDKSK